MNNQSVGAMEGVILIGAGIILLVANAAPAADISAVVPVDDRTQIIAGAITPGAADQQFQQRIQVRNLSGDTLKSPLILALKKRRPDTLNLANLSGSLDDGSPYVEIPLEQGKLAPGRKSEEVNLEFSVADSAELGYAGRVYAVLPEDANRPPIANPGLPVKLNPGSASPLDASASTDRDGDVLSYHWELIKKPRRSRAALTGADTVDPSLTPDRPGNYTLKLVVNDGHRDSLPARFTYSTRKVAPVAVAGADQTVAIGTVATLQQESFDPDGATLRYAWSLAGKPKGSKTRLSGARSAAPSLTPDRPGSYRVSLVVTDGDRIKSAPDFVVIDTVNSAPQAVATVDPAGALGLPLSLSGTQSSDADGDVLSYRWSLLSTPSGSDAALTGAEQATASVTPDQNGTYVFQLIVDDGIAQSTPTTAKTTVGSAGTGNRPPRITPVLSRDRRGTVGQLYDIDVDATDRNGDPITFSSTLSD